MYAVLGCSERARVEDTCIPIMYAALGGSAQACRLNVLVQFTQYLEKARNGTNKQFRNT